MGEDKELRTVGSYAFSLERDAQLAEREQHNIDALKGKMNLEHVTELETLYCRLAEKKVFKTPIGYQFMGEFREYLVNDRKLDNDKLPYVPVDALRGPDRKQREQVEQLQNENQSLIVNQKKYRIGLGVCIVLILAMIVATILNPNVGYINTENKILNRYSAWEEELTKREEAVKEKEAELGISTENGASTETGGSTDTPVSGTEK